MTEMSRSVIFEAFDAFPQACAVVDADLRILQTNPALCSLAGRSAKALTGLGFNTFGSTLVLSARACPPAVPSPDCPA